MAADVNTPISAYEAMAEKWALPETLYEGTRAMREAGKTYLPQEPAESDEAYRNRLNRSVLFNAFKRAVQTLRGKVFAKPVALSEDATERAKVWADDIDLEGRDLTAFSREVFESALLRGVSYILVDFPQVQAGATLADERAMNARPYFTHISARQIIGWRIERVGGVRKLMRVRIRESVNEPDGEWGEMQIDQVRVLEPGMYTIYRQPGHRKDWEIYEQGTTSLDFIPLVPVYTSRLADMEAEPPLSDLADLNLTHWQSSSDQRHILHVARVPILFMAGYQEDDAPMEIGPNRLIKSSDTSASLRYVEHTGAAVEAGRNDLKDIEDQMSLMSLEPLLPKTGNQTATARALDQAQANSTLQDWAGNLQDSLELSFYFADQWIGESDGARVTVNTDFGMSISEAEDLKVLQQARLSGDLSRMTLWSEFKRRGLLDDQFSAEDEAALLELEGPSMTLPNGA